MESIVTLFFRVSFFAFNLFWKYNQEFNIYDIFCIQIPPNPSSFLLRMITLFERVFKEIRYTIIYTRECTFGRRGREGLFQWFYTGNRNTCQINPRFCWDSYYLLFSNHNFWICIFYSLDRCSNSW